MTIDFAHFVDDSARERFEQPFPGGGLPRNHRNVRREMFVTYAQAVPGPRA